MTEIYQKYNRGFVNNLLHLLGQNRRGMYCMNCNFRANFWRDRLRIFVCGFEGEFWTISCSGRANWVPENVNNVAHCCQNHNYHGVVGFIIISTWSRKCWRVGMHAWELRRWRQAWVGQQNISTYDLHLSWWWSWGFIWGWRWFPYLKTKIYHSNVIIMIRRVVKPISSFQGQRNSLKWFSTCFLSHINFIFLKHSTI